MAPSPPQKGIGDSYSQLGKHHFLGFHQPGKSLGGVALQTLLDSNNLVTSQSNRVKFQSSGQFMDVIGIQTQKRPSDKCVNHQTKNTTKKENEGRHRTVGIDTLESGIIGTNR